MSLPVTSSQGRSSQHGVRQRALQSLEQYFYLILFNYYLHEQVGLGEGEGHSHPPGVPPALSPVVTGMGLPASPVELGRGVGTSVLVPEEGGCGGRMERPS